MPISSLLRIVFFLIACLVIVIVIQMSYRYFFPTDSSVSVDSVEITREEKHRLVEQLTPDGAAPVSEKELEGRLKALNTLNSDSAKSDSSRELEVSTETKLNTLQSLHGTQ